MSKKLVEVKSLSKYFNISRKQRLHAVENISFDIYEGETLGIVGESGCGKTTLGRTLLGLYSPTGGEVYYEGDNIFKYNKKEALKFKGQAQIILQDPYASLNPRMTVKEIISEGILAHKLYKEDEAIEKEIERLLGLVGLDAQFKNRYPHEFSGGQRQRIGIARALAVKPRFIVCDEPISALDVSVQAQIINLFMQLQREMNLTYLFIAHDLSMVRYLSDRVGVMYLGQLVELGPCEEVYERTLHPYAKALISSIPSIEIDKPLKERRIRLEGELTSPINPKEGCRFYNRCPYKIERCLKESPLLREIEEGHYVACHQVGGVKK